MGDQKTMKECWSFFCSTRTRYARRTTGLSFACHEHDEVTAEGSSPKSFVVLCFCDKLLASIQKDNTTKGHEYPDNDDRLGWHTCLRSFHFPLSVLGGDCVLEAFDML